MARARFGDLLFAQQVLHGDAVERGDMGEDEDVRRAVAALPLGDGLIGVAELFRKTGLRVAVQLAVIGNVFGDELPQLFNILKGDMTIVGPRPERPEIAAQYEEEMPAFNLRLQVKAGLTGFAQVEGRYNTTPYDKLQMDLMYINSMSVSEDLRLMFATVKILFIKDSTEGIADGQVTASVKAEEIKENATVVSMERSEKRADGTYGTVVMHKN